MELLIIIFVLIIFCGGLITAILLATKSSTRYTYSGREYIVENKEKVKIWKKRGKFLQREDSHK